MVKVVSFVLSQYKLDAPKSEVHDKYKRYLPKLFQRNKRERHLASKRSYTLGETGVMKIGLYFWGEVAAEDALATGVASENRKTTFVTENTKAYS